MKQLPYGYNNAYGEGYYKDDLPDLGLQIFYSVGDRTQDYKTVDDNGNLFITIKYGIATFSFPQSNLYLGAGDIVSHSAGSCFLKQKIDQSTWYVTDHRGFIPEDIQYKSVSNITKVFSTLREAIDGPNPGLNQYLPFDLTGDYQPNIVCYELNETSTIVIQNLFTLNPNRSIRIYTPFDVVLECNSKQRHNGVLGSGYKIQPVSSGDNVITNHQDNIKIEGLQITGGLNGIISDGSNTLFRNNLITECSNDGINDVNIDSTISTSVFVGNTIYSCGSSCVEVGSTVASAEKNYFIYNNTTVGSSTGLLLKNLDTNTFITVKNNLAQNNTTDYSPTGSQVIAYNSISKDATVNNFSTHTDCHASTTVIFADVTNDDYHLSSVDANAISQGMDLSNDADYPFNIDIDCDIIYTPWSVGSDYSVHKSVFSISQNTNFISCNINNITDSIAEFSTAQTGNYFGVGHLITYDTSKTCYIIDKLSTTRWRVAGADGTAISDESGPITVNSVDPAFSSLKDAINGVPCGISTAIGSADLIAANLKIEVACYCILDNTALFGIVISDWTVDAIRNIHVYSPTNLITQCNFVQKFSGNDGYGYEFYNGIYVQTANTIIEGLRIANGGVVCTNAPNGTIRDCLIKPNSINNNGVVIQSNIAGNWSVFNNLIYDAPGNGIYVNYYGSNNTSETYCFNNTVINCENGILFNSQINVYSNKLISKNNICQGSLVKDYNLMNVNSGQFLISDSISSDETVNAYEIKTNKINTILTFLDYENKDFHLNFDDLITVGYCEDLSCNPVFQFNTDFDNEDRKPGRWNAGVDNFTNKAKNEVFYSVGTSLNDFKSFESTITIIDGLAYFSNPQTCMNLGIGDCVTYNTSLKCYLAFKLTPYIWRVVTAIGSKPSDISPSIITSIKRAFNSLVDAVIEASDVDHTNTQDLISLEANLNLTCYNDEDDNINSSINISGWTTNNDYQINVFSPWKETQVNKKQEHNGNDGNGYTLVSNNIGAIIIQNNYVNIQGLQIDGVTKNGDGILIDSSMFSPNYITLKNNIVKNFTIGVHGTALFGPNSNIIGNVIHDCTSGIDAAYVNTYNNTIVNCTNGHSVDSNSIGKNNIVQDCTTCFNRNDILWNCISSDSSAGSSQDNQHDIHLNFKDKTNKDYHLIRFDIKAVGKGVDLSNSFTTDINNNLIQIWSIGADCPTFETLDLVFSVGSSDTDHKSGNILNGIQIINSIAHFTTAQISDNIGIGDIVSYGADLHCYLKEKIDTFHWKVVDKFGNQILDHGITQLTSIKHVYMSLVNSIDEIHTLLGIYDIASAKFNIRVACYNDLSGPTDSSITEILNWVTDAENTITIKPPVDINKECNKSQKHNGYANTGYQIRSTGSDTILLLGCDNILVEGIEIWSVTPSTQTGIQFSTTSQNNKVIDCIVHDVNDGISFISSSTYTHYVVNNIVYSTVNNGILCDKNWIVYNNTVVGCGTYGINNQQTSTVVINNIVQDSSSGDFYSNTTIQNCISKDSSAGSANGCQNTITLSFTNKPEHIYKLSKSVGDIPARGTGQILTYDSLFPFNYDAIGTTRGIKWDVGALEFLDFKKVYYSVGRNSDDNKTGNSLLISINDGIATFSTPQISDKIGVGDVVFYHNGLKCFLTEKITTSIWRVVDNKGNNPSNENNVSVTSIHRVFFSLYTAMSIDGASSFDYLGTTDLKINGYQLNVTCYNDIMDDLNATINGWTTDDDCCINVYTPFNVNSECNKSQRHQGNESTGYQLASDINSVLKIDNVNFVKIEGLSIGRLYDLYQVIGVELINSNYITILSNVIYDCSNIGILNNVPLNESATKNNIVNNVIYNNNIGIKDVSIGYLNSNNTTCIYNNTIINNTYGLVVNDVDRTLSTDHHIFATNNIFQRNRIAVNYTINHNTTFIMNRCLSNDNTVIKLDSVNCIPDYFLFFTNPNNNIFMLDPEWDSIAIDSGKDLHDDINYPFTTDILNRARISGLWDLGAFENYPINCSGDLSCEHINSIGSYAVLNHDFPPTILYLRRQVDKPKNVFTSIEKLSEYLKQEIYDSFEIYVQANETFWGTIDFGDRGDNKNITIETDPDELSAGPSTMAAALLSTYNSGAAPLISNESNQQYIKFLNMKLRMNDLYLDQNFVNNTSLTNYILIENSIVQTNKNNLRDSGGNPCTFEIINSQIIYRDSDHNNTLYINKNADNQNTIKNTILATYYNNSVTFHTETLDTRKNCLLYNFSGQGQSFNIDPVPDNCLTVDPKFIEQEIFTIETFNINEVMSHSFVPQYASPCREAGCDISSYHITTDIIGQPRTIGDIIDIGPYELNIFQTEFTSSQIKDLYQDKLIYKGNEVTGVFVTKYKNKTYEDLPKKFAYNKSECDEFARESKIFIELKPYTKDYVITTDKINISLVQLEAYYDNAQNTIIVKKIPQLIGNLFAKIFETGQYFFSFNERTNTLYIYIIDTYNKGISGIRDIVNNERYGGSSMTSI